MAPHPTGVRPRPRTLIPSGLSSLQCLLFTVSFMIDALDSTSRFFTWYCLSEWDCMSIEYRGLSLIEWYDNVTVLLWNAAWGWPAVTSLSSPPSVLGPAKAIHSPTQSPDNQLFLSHTWIYSPFNWVSVKIFSWVCIFFHFSVWKSSLLTGAGVCK